MTLRDLIEWTSRDAVRFFLISRKADTEFVFDIDLALKRNDENPVFYVQYAHARICSVLSLWAGERAADARPATEAELERLTAPSETALMRELARFPEVLARAADEFAPHDLAFYLRDVAAAFHTYYSAERFLVDDAALARARMALLARHASGVAQRLRGAGHLGARQHGARIERGVPMNMSPTRPAVTSQRGGFVMGLIVGLLVGLALALGVACTSPRRRCRSSTRCSSARRNRTRRRSSATRTGIPTRRWPTSRPRRAPPARRRRASTQSRRRASPRCRRGRPRRWPNRRARRAIRPRSCRGASPPPIAIAPQSAKPGVDPFVYFVQVGAFSKAEDAEAQRAKLAMLGYAAKVTEREQSGRMMYRVRLGPLPGARRG